MTSPFTNLFCSLQESIKKNKSVYRGLDWTSSWSREFSQSKTGHLPKANNLCISTPANTFFLHFFRHKYTLWWGLYWRRLCYKQLCRTMTVCLIKWSKRRKSSRCMDSLTVQARHISAEYISGWFLHHSSHGTEICILFASVVTQNSSIRTHMLSKPNVKIHETVVLILGLMEKRAV